MQSMQSLWAALLITTTVFAADNFETGGPLAGEKLPASRKRRLHVGIDGGGPVDLCGLGFC